MEKNPLEEMSKKVEKKLEEERRLYVAWIEKNNPAKVVQMFPESKKQHA